MVRLYVKEIKATKTNYQSLLELRREIKKRKIKDTKIRQEIIFYDTLIGCIKARKEKPERFVSGKQITSEILEADYIAQQREKTLKHLEENYTPERILDELHKEAELLKKEEVLYGEGLYKKIIGLNITSVQSIGGRLEQSLTKHRRIINSSTGDRKKAMFLWREAESIYEIVSGEVERVKVGNIREEKWNPYSL